MKAVRQQFTAHSHSDFLLYPVTFNLSANNHYDPIGNVLFISDTSGNVNTSYVQEEFGNVIATSGAASNNYHLTTKEQDPDTVLYYFSARWYDPGVGRFVSFDPILRGSNISNEDNTQFPFYNFTQYNHQYNYPFSNPVNLVDADGKGIIVILPIVITIGGTLWCLYQLDKCLEYAEKACKPMCGIDNKGWYNCVINLCGNPI